MSTPKKDATKKVAAVAKDGNIVGHRAITADKDGNVREATPEEMAQAKNAFITVASKTDKGIEIANTYDCFIQHYDNGNIGLFIRTSNKLDDVEVDNPHPTQLGDGVGENKKITLVGRGNALAASFALVQCFRAYGTPFGQASAYRMVKMTLDKGTKNWHGLFVPALAIASM